MDIHPYLVPYYLYHSHSLLQSFVRPLVLVHIRHGPFRDVRDSDRGVKAGVGVELDSDFGFAS